MPETKSLEKFIFKDTNTLPIMDEFDKKIGDKYVYDKLIIKNQNQVTVDGTIYIYCLMIQRIKYQGNNVVGGITMTEFKKHKGNVLQYSNEYLSKYLPGKKVKIKETIFFDLPYYLRAQNSGNRTGYGWEWEWDNCLYEGTQYGECDDYGFVGVEIEGIKKIPKKNKTEYLEMIKQIPDPIKIETTTVHGCKYFKLYKSSEEAYLIPYRANKPEQAVFEYKRELYKMQKKMTK